MTDTQANQGLGLIRVEPEHPKLPAFDKLARGFKVALRMATDEDGEQLKWLAEHQSSPQAGLAIEGVELDWSAIGNHWVVAEGLVNNTVRIVGAAQITASRPVGHMEFMLTHADLSHRQKAVTVAYLLKYGASALFQLGIKAYVGIIPFEMKSYKKMLKKRGGVVLCSGNLLICGT
jgi:hypothetical protein